MYSEDTIAAISTAVGGAIAIIRISGAEAWKICLEVWHHEKYKNPNNLPIGKMMLGTCSYGSCTDAREKAFAVFFKAPHSYTGENMAEIHCHGGSLISSGILKELIQAGARQAEPGEFTYRAFINGKMDLSQAEAVADIINARTQLALDMAQRQLDGAIKDKISLFITQITEIIAECEFQLDFSEDNLLSSDFNIKSEIEKVLSGIREMLNTTTDGILIRNGIKIVIAGHPNAGKSSLFNRLLQEDRAIVTDIPGTTRDSIEAEIIIRGIRAVLIDTAGIRQADDLIEKLGIEKSKKSIQSADMVIWLLDPTEDHHAQLTEMKKHCPNKERTLAVWNKSDLLDEHTQKTLHFDGYKGCIVSAKEGKNIDKLKDICLELAGFNELSDLPKIAVNTRHSALLQQAYDNLQLALKEAESQRYETSALFLKEARKSLKQITGEEISQDVLDIIFSKFCIGK